MRVTLPEFRTLKAKAAARKAKKAEKRVELAGSPTPPHGPAAPQDAILGPLRPQATRHRTIVRNRRPKARIKRGALKAAIVRLLGLLDAKKNGKMCRFHKDHPGDTSCHIVPQARGDAARFIPENVYWGCRSANYGEFRHRSLYRDHHVRIFGKDLVERLEGIAREIKQYKMSELLALRADLKSQMEAA